MAFTMNDYYSSIDFKRDNPVKDITIKEFGSAIVTDFTGSNVAASMSQSASTGQGAFELGSLQRQKFEEIPQQQWDEVRRLGKLTGVKPSLHAPMVDVLGKTVSGEFSEKKRKEVVNEMMEYLKTGNTIDPDNNTPVNFHSSVGVGGENSFSGVYYQKGLYKGPKDEDIELAKIRAEKMGLPDWRVLVPEATEKLAAAAVDVNTGRIEPLIYKEVKQLPRTFEEEKRGYHLEVYTPESRITSLNKNAWDQEMEKILGSEHQIFKIKRNFEGINRDIEEAGETFVKINQDLKEKKIEESYAKYEKLKLIQTIEQKKREMSLMSANIQQIDEAMDSQVNSIYDNLNKSCENASEELKEVYQDKIKSLSNISAKYSEDKMAIRKIMNEIRGELNKQYGEKVSRDKLDQLAKQGDQTAIAYLEANNRLINIDADKIKEVADSMQNLPDELQYASNGKITYPERFRLFEDFAIEKGSETFSDLAERAYEEWTSKGKNAPLITIENPPVGQFAISRADELKKLIEDSRSKFAEKLIKNKHLDEKKAKKLAEEMISATWDVGHINFLKSMGYDDKDIIKETEKIAKYVKHLHITDNFGTSDSHLAPGMGNVPIEEIMKSLDKAGFEGRKIIEAGKFISDFKESDIPYAMDYFKSPLYSGEMAPNWKETRMQSLSTGYGAEFGEFLPSSYFSMYGAPGFVNLPTDLGGSMSTQGKSQFSGTPME